MGAMKGEAKASNDKIIRLQAHLEKSQARYDSKQISPKHMDAPEEYLKWLKLEIDRTKSKIESLKAST